MQHQGYTWRDWLIISFWILATVLAVALVVTGVVPVGGACMPGAAVVDPSCVPH